MHIYVEIMHTLIHMCRVLHSYAFPKKPYYSVKRYRSFQMTKLQEIVPSNPNWLEFGHCKIFEVHKARKGHEITVLTWKMRRPREWKKLKVDSKRYKRRLPK